MKKVYLDIYLARNLGDDLFLEILLNRYPNVIFFVNYHGPDYMDFFEKFKNLQRIRYNIIFKVLRKFRIYNRLKDFNLFSSYFDGLIFLGGGIFREETYGYDLFDERFSLVKQFKSKNKPVFFISCNFGPFRNDIFVDKYKKLFELCYDVCFRDLKSYNIFKNIHSVRYAPDLVFSLKKSLKFKIKDHFCGVSLINPRHKEGFGKYYSNYLIIHSNIIENLICQGYKVILFSFCEKEGDMEVAKDLLNSIKKDLRTNIVIKNYELDFKTFLNDIIKCELMIASRFHAIVISLIYKIKLLPFIYNEKNSNLLNDIEFQNISIDFNSDSEVDYSKIFFNYNFPNIETYLSNQDSQFAILDSLFLDENSNKN